jgi:hypothetical protein
MKKKHGELHEITAGEKLEEAHRKQLRGFLGFLYECRVKQADALKDARKEKHSDPFSRSGSFPQ